MRSRSFAATLTLMLLSATVGCSSAPEDEETVTSEAEGELRALTASELAGEIAYGAIDVEVDHPGETGSRRIYRAVKFEGKRGDEIVASAKIADDDADPVLYLLGSDFRTMKSNDDRAPGVTESEIKAKLSRDGTYYLAFRSKEKVPAKFLVSLRDRFTRSEVDLFAAATGEQASLSNDALVARFAPGRSRAALGELVLIGRHRGCNTTTGCTQYAVSSKVKQLRTVGTRTASLPDGRDEIRGTTELTTTQAGQIWWQFQDTSYGDLRFERVALGSSGNPLQSWYRSCNGTYCFDTNVNVGLWGKPTRFKIIATKDYVYGRSELVSSKVTQEGFYEQAELVFIAPLDSGKAPALRVHGENAYASF